MTNKNAFLEDLINNNEHKVEREYNEIARKIYNISMNKVEKSIKEGDTKRSRTVSFRFMDYCVHKWTGKFLTDITPKVRAVFKENGFDPTRVNLHMDGINENNFIVNFWIGE